MVTLIQGDRYPISVQIIQDGIMLYRSKVDSNVYTPEQYAANWEQVAL